MTIRYVGPGGSDGASGLSWALRKETLNGVEDTPVVAGDIVYVGPGVYRELLTVDVDGSDGNVIEYIGDTSGKNTDGLGGVVRITGSDDDTSTPHDRTRCIYIDGKDYRTFRGFSFDSIDGASTSLGYIYFDGGVTDLTIEECMFSYSSFTLGDSSDPCACIYCDCSSGTFARIEIRNCFFQMDMDGIVIHGGVGSDINLPDSKVENCFFAGAQTAVDLHLSYGFTVRHCSFISSSTGCRTYGGSHTNYVYDSLFLCNTPINEFATAYFAEDYNIFIGRTTGMDGANSFESYFPRRAPTIFGGFRFPWEYTFITDVNSDVYSSNTSSLTEDIYGLTRPASGKRTRGAVQIRATERDSDVYRTSPASLLMRDTSNQLFTVPLTPNKKYRVSAYVRREADYAGTNPQIIIKRLGQANVTTTDSGGVGTWNKIMAEITAGATDRLMQVELRSNNTATSGNYKVNFDDIIVRGIGIKIPNMFWATNEIVLFNFSLEEVLDPWIAPTIPVPGTLGGEGNSGPYPVFVRQT